MIAKPYQKILQNQLHHSRYLLITLVVASLQLLRQVKLEVLAQALPLPILFESRRKKLRRFLRIKQFNMVSIWFPCVSALLEEMFKPNDRIYLAIDRTSWGVINILMVSVIYDHRAWPIYWEFLDKKGSSNFDEQTAVLGKSIGLLSNYRVVVLGDREFCSPKLGNWLGLQGAYFCLRQKYNTFVCYDTEVERELKDYGLKPGVKLFLNDCQVTKKKGFGTFNIAGKWKRNYQGFKTKEPWYILTNFDDVDTAIVAYQRRFSIEEMFRDFKSGGYSIEGSKLTGEYLSKLMIVVAIAYTSAMLQGRHIKQMGIQKYVVRPETKSSGQRRHSAFYVGQHQHSWLRLRGLCEKIVDELLQINRRWLNYYLKGERAIELALSTL
ncbi:IS4 family transposase [Moorena sp. SIO4G3]|uniref:IS4 family transposase n=1 Tax=Moorena sp. SIO4G3 TaxID=2607821 RepID=UPI00142ABB2B|nr:IS4 family transposase [Moorena sp. SIO4G3]NEO79915.1 IS4 family transposase [Moorena sp. SIO4G3]